MKSFTLQIVSDGKEVKVIKNGKTATAKCHPEDNFDFFTGLEIALKKLKAKEEQKPFSVEDLKAGYVIKFKDNSLAMITYGNKGDLCVSGPDHWFPVECFNKSLRYGDNEIKQVYGYACNMCA